MVSTHHIFLESVEKETAIRRFDHFREFEPYLDEQNELDRGALFADVLVDIDVPGDEVGEILDSVITEVIEHAVLGMYILNWSGQSVDEDTASLIASPIFHPFNPDSNPLAAFNGIGTGFSGPLLG